MTLDAVYVDAGTYGGLYSFARRNGNSRFANTELEQYDEWVAAAYDGDIYTFVEGTLQRHDANDGAIVDTISVTWDWRGWSMQTGPVFSPDGMAYVVAHCDPLHVRGGDQAARLDPREQRLRNARARRRAGPGIRQPAPSPRSTRRPVSSRWHCDRARRAAASAGCRQWLRLRIESHEHVRGGPARWQGGLADRDRGLAVDRRRSPIHRGPERHLA